MLLFLNSELSNFNCTSLNDFQCLFQDAFCRATLLYDNKNVILFNTPEITSLKNENHSIFIDTDILKFQNIIKLKPYSDDFAQFSSDYFEYSRFFLLSKSHKFDIYHPVQRSRSPYFFLSDEYKYYDKNHKAFSLSYIFGHSLISFGAFYLIFLTFN